MSDSRRILDTQVAGCSASHQRLLQSLDILTDEQCRQPSSLGGWTRGHVLSHLAANALSHVRLFSAVARGEEVEQYEGGMASRDAQIESGAHRTASELVAAVRAAIYALEGEWARATEQTWSGYGVKSHVGGARTAIRDLVMMRWCESEVHHTDLDLGFRIDEWDATFVRFELDRQMMVWRSRLSMGLTVLPGAAGKLPPNQRLAWLLGRINVDGLPSVDPY